MQCDWWLHICSTCFAKDQVRLWSDGWMKLKRQQTLTTSWCRCVSCDPVLSPFIPFLLFPSLPLSLISITQWVCCIWYASMIVWLYLRWSQNSAVLDFVLHMLTAFWWALSWQSIVHLLLFFSVRFVLPAKLWGKKRDPVVALLSMIFLRCVSTIEVVT